MKAKIQGFLGSNHSWSIVQQNIARSLVKNGYEVHLSSTNGYEHFPADLKPYVREKLDGTYDLQVSYTAMKNFPVYLNHGSKNRFGIWNYETTVLPRGFSKYHLATDLMLPSSEFSKRIFAENGVPESRMEVVPHGFDTEAFKTPVKYPLKTKKKLKILANIAQPHIRKNIPGLLEAFGRAFTSKDDVCLVAKISAKPLKEFTFEIDFYNILAAFKRKYKQHAEIELVTEFIPNIAELYNSCDIVFSTTFAECFWLPGLESMAASKITIAPNYGGQLDFMNDSNSLLISGKKVPAPKAMQYWSTSPYAAMFEPNLDNAAELLQTAYQKHDELALRFKPGMDSIVERFTWDAAVKKIISLCKE